MTTILKKIISAVFVFRMFVTALSMIVLSMTVLSMTVLSMTACGELEEVVDYCNKFCVLTKDCLSISNNQYDLCIMDCELIGADGVDNKLNQHLIDCSKTDSCKVFIDCVEENK